MTAQARRRFRPAPPGRIVKVMSIDLAGRLRDAVAPNWFAAVMGTGILVTAAAGLPVGPAVAQALRPAELAAWSLAVLLLLAVTGLTLAQWLTRPDLARRHHHHPVLAHFYGAPPMALLTVGAGTLLVGSDWIGTPAAVDADAALWSLGTLLGLASCVAVPYLTFTGGLGELARRPEAAFGGWLMSVVPPMVSASTGALLLPHLAAGQLRLTLLLACYAMAGVSLLAALMITGLIWGRLARFGLPEPRMVPTLWIVLGPLGQSVTAADLLGGQAHLALPAPFAAALRAAGLVYGVPVLGFALVWLGLAAILTTRTALTGAGMPFAATWWAFTFPVGTCVTGASTLARLTGADAVTGLAELLFAGLVGAWVVVAVHTVGSVPRGGGPLPDTTGAGTATPPRVRKPAAPGETGANWAYSI